METSSIARCQSRRRPPFRLWFKLALPCLAQGLFIPPIYSLAEVEDDSFDQGIDRLTPLSV